LDVSLDAETIEARLKGWKAPAQRYATGVFARYASSVASAAEGAVMK
jgi:dihydroxyacid dehydratase/phosphogluconate dehydratase